MIHPAFLRPLSAATAVTGGGARLEVLYNEREVYAGLKLNLFLDETGCRESTRRIKASADVGTAEEGSRQKGYGKRRESPCGSMKR